MESQNNIDTCSINNITFNLVKSHTDKNIIKVSSKREIFFDVFECIVCDGQTLVLEKVDEVDMLPIVNVEFILDGKIYTCEAVLIEDSYEEFVVNEDNIFFSRYVSVMAADTHSNDIDEESGYIGEEVKDFSNSNNHISYEDQKNSFIQLLDEQLNFKLSSLKEDFSAQLETFLEKVTGGSSRLIEGKLAEIDTTVEEKFQNLKEDIKHIEDFSKQNITEAIKKKISEIEGFFNLYLENLGTIHEQREGKNLTKINNNLLKINTVKESIQKSNSSIDILQTKIKVLEELESKIITLDDIKERFVDEDRINKESENIIQFVTEKILELSDNIQANSKEQEKRYDSFVDSISVEDIEEVKTIIHDKIDEVQIAQLKESLQSDIEKSLKGDIMHLKRYAEMVSGGGSVAVQYANGGIMNGNLTVVGSITASDSITVGGVNTPYVAFDTAAAETGGVGKLVWNDEDGTLDLGLKGGNVTLQVGQETVIRAVNKTSTNLLEANYQVARIRTEAEGGTQGQRLAIVLAQADNDNNSVDTLGLVTENIDNNQEGFITTFGLVRNINTTGSLQGETWSDGDVVYLSSTVAGVLTNIRPLAPQHTVILGFVVYSHQNNGKIFVKVDNGYELDELHNVRIDSVTNNNLLAYDSLSGVWKNTNSVNVSTLSATSLSADRIYTTQLDALSANITVIDIKQYELSGFDVTGNVSISGNMHVTDNITLSGDLYINGVASDISTAIGSLSGSIVNTNANVEYLSGSIDITNANVEYLSSQIGGGGGAWGDITGTLSAQTDLQSALDLKADLASPTFTGISIFERITLSQNSFIVETADFTLSSAHNGATVLLQNAVPITITIPSLVAGHTTTFISETINSVTFAAGVGLSGFNSYNNANQIAGIYGQAQIIFKSSDYAFLGGSII